MTPLPTTPTCTHSDFWLAALCVTVWFLFAVVVGLVWKLNRLDVAWRELGEMLERVQRGMAWLRTEN